MNLELVSVNDGFIKNCEIFIQTVLFNRTSKEICVETRLRLYNKQKTKNPISLPLDTLSCKITICRSKKEITVDGYEKKSRKSKQIYVMSNKKPVIQVNPVKLPITLC